MSMLRSLKGIPALIAIVALGLLGTLLLGGWPFLRRIAWAGAALVALVAAVNEFRR